MREEKQGRREKRMYPLLGHFVFRSKRPEANAQEVFASASLLVTFTGTSPPPTGLHQKLLGLTKSCVPISKFGGPY